jgi:hypothetical protein
MRTVGRMRPFNGRFGDAFDNMKRIFRLPAVSQHRDGWLIGSILRWFGVRVVHGSSRGGAVTAVRRAMALLQDRQQFFRSPQTGRAVHGACQHPESRKSLLSPSPNALGLQATVSCCQLAAPRMGGVALGGWRKRLSQATAQGSIHERRSRGLARVRAAWSGRSRRACRRSCMSRKPVIRAAVWFEGVLVPRLVPGDSRCGRRPSSE